LTMLKGLPLAYNKDMQEDKEAIFDTVDNVKICLQAAAMVLNNLYLNEKTTSLAATKGYLNATELADYLVKKGVAFREAHDTVGQAVLFGLEQSKELHELGLNELRQFSDRIDLDVFDALSLDQTLASKNQTGGTSPKRVFEALAAARKKIGK
jgi:Argininosuccinate lyase